MECFKWAVIAADRWEEIDKHLERISKLRKFEEEYNWIDVEFPFAIRSIDKFERKNEISVNILAVESRRIFICRNSDYRYERVVNLMIITGENSFPDQEEKFNRKHYIAIKSLSRLLAKKTLSMRQLNIIPRIAYRDFLVKLTEINMRSIVETTRSFESKCQ